MQLTHLMNPDLGDVSPSSADSILVRPSKPKLHRESRRVGFILYEALYGPLIFLKAVYRQLIILLAMFVSGAVIFAHYNALSPISAFLASVSTITTIGLYVPNNVFSGNVNQDEAVLLIVMIIVSVGAGASIVQGTVNAAVNSALAKGEAEKRMISRLKNHAIVFGYSHLGRYVVEKLEELGFDYVVITKEDSVYNELLRNDILAVMESGIQPLATLKLAGIERASLVVVAHQDDPDNMLTILSARKIRPDIRIITVVHDASLIETAKNAGADVVIPSSVTVGHLLALSAVTKDLVGVVFSEKIGTKEIAQFSIFKSSPLIGKGLEEVSRYANVIGVVRGNAVVENIFAQSFTLQQNDTLLVLGDPSNLEHLEQTAEAV